MKKRRERRDWSIPEMREKRSIRWRNWREPICFSREFPRGTKVMTLKKRWRKFL
jgi:hypothetical protein